MSGLLVVHTAVTWFLAGLIWTVQLVHYPLMASVGSAAFGAYERAHMRRIGWIVVPAMLLEAVTGLALFLPAAGVAPLPASIGAALLLVVWVSTALVQARCHERLAEGFDERVHRHLVRSNWVRTAAWTARGVLVCLMMAASGSV